MTLTLKLTWCLRVKVPTVVMNPRGGWAQEARATLREASGCALATPGLDEGSAGTWEWADLQGDAGRSAQRLGDRPR